MLAKAICINKFFLIIFEIYYTQLATLATPLNPLSTVSSTAQISRMQGSSFCQGSSSEEGITEKVDSIEAGCIAIAHLLP